jgi:hypothetical protein
MHSQSRQVQPQGLRDVKINHRVFRTEAGFECDCTGSAMYKIIFATFVPGPITPGIEVITKLDMAHQALPAIDDHYA